MNEITGNHTLQLYYAHKAYDIAKTIHNKEWMAYSLCRIAFAHSRLHHKDSTLTFMNLANVITGIRILCSIVFYEFGYSIFRLYQEK